MSRPITPACPIRRALATGCLLAAVLSPSPASAAVTVTKSNNGVLNIVGDSEEDYVEIDGSGTFGKLDVFVWGNHEGTFHNVTSIVADLGPGTQPDVLDVGGIEIPGDLTFYGGAGNNALNIDVLTNSDNTLRSVEIGGNVLAAMGMGIYDGVRISTAELDNVDRVIHIGGDVTLFSARSIQLEGWGADSGGRVDRNVYIDGNITIWANPGSPRVPQEGQFRLRNLDVLGSTTLLAPGDFPDTCRLYSCEFVGRVSILLGSGDDLVDIGAGKDYPGLANIFEDKVTVALGQGFDTVVDSPFNLYAVPPKFTGVEDFP